MELKNEQVKKKRMNRSSCDNVFFPFSDIVSFVRLLDGKLFTALKSLNQAGSRKPHWKTTKYLNHRSIFVYKIMVGNESSHISTQVFLCDLEAKTFICY